MTAKTQSGASKTSLAGSVSGWCRSHPVRLCVLYGSRARGVERRDSDVDLALWAASLPSPDERLAWRRELAETTGLPVQLVFVTPDLDPVLGLQIAREGRALHEDAPGSWTAERLRLWHLYQDSRPFLLASRRSLRRLVDETHDGA